MTDHVVMRPEKGVGGGGENDFAAWNEDAEDFIQHKLILLNMFNDIEDRDDIHTVIFQWDAPADVIKNAGSEKFAVRILKRMGREIDSDDFSIRGKQGKKKTRSESDVKYPLLPGEYFPPDQGVEDLVLAPEPPVPVFIFLEDGVFAFLHVEKEIYSGRGQSKLKYVFQRSLKFISSQFVSLTSGVATCSENIAAGFDSNRSKTRIMKGGSR